MKEILKIINISYSYNVQLANLIIKFIRKFEEIEINQSLIEIVKLIENILTKRKNHNDLKSLESILNSLKDEHKKEISYKEIIDTLEKITKKEIRKNNNKNEEVLFLKLIIPIKILDDLKLEKDIKEKIELIDIPGLNTEQKYLENKHFKTLIKYSYGFLFVTKKDSTKEKSNKDIIYDVICKIRHRKIIDFSFNSLFFILTNESSNKINMEDKKKDIKNSINFNDSIINDNIKDDQEFLISEFSNPEYKKYLEDYNITYDYNKFYEYLKKNNKKIENFLVKLEDNNYANYQPSEDDLKKYIIIKNENNFISKYLFLRNNISTHISLIKSNYLEFKENFSKIIDCSKKSLDESIKNSIINFITYLRSKLYKIYWPNQLADIDIEIVNKKLSDLQEGIKIEIDNFEQDFKLEIAKLEKEVKNRTTREQGIVDFSLKWRTKKNNLDEKIKNLIVNKYSEIDDLKHLKDSEYEKKKYFSKKHIIAHGATAGAQVIGEGAAIIFTTISISLPPIAIAIGAFALIHGGICVFKLIRDKIKESDDLIEHISKYKNTFIDNLDSYKTDINTFLSMRKEMEIREINDKIIADSVKLNDEEKKQLNKIYSSFEEKLDSNFNLE